MYGEPGHAYVYFNYGMHYLVNVVTEPRGVPAAVLVRALEPVDGVALMERRRGRTRSGRAPGVHDLCRGPGNLTRALGIGPSQNRADLTGGPEKDAASTTRLWIEDRGVTPGRVAWGPRIGIRVGLDRPWRCVIAGHPCLSRSPRP
jgi:DNA-3-methyladenine glycosylase